MAEVTKIQWTTHTFNPWIGCTKVATGCQHCYAEADMDKRRGRVKWGPNGTRSRTTEAYWKQPLKWNRLAECNCGAAGLGPQECAFCAGGCVRPRVFCASLADVFEDIGSDFVFDHRGERMYRRFPEVSKPTNDPADHYRVGLPELRKDLFALIDATPNLDWLLLTKRPENILKMWPVTHDRRPIFPGMPGPLGEPQPCVISGARRNNVWLGTSISDQATAGKAIPELLKCRDLAPVLFLSAEPLLGPIDLTRVGNHDGTCANCFDGNCLYVGDIGGVEYAWSRRNFISWVIVGGESGPNARPCCQTWIRELVRQCSDAGVSCFVKQFGSNAEEGYGVNRKLRLKDFKGGDPDEWPEDLRVREFPGVSVSLG